MMHSNDALPIECQPLEANMTLDDVRALCLAQRGAEETTPFGPETLVYKVMGKMFALLPAVLKPDETPYVVTKAEPFYGQMLRDTYPAVTGAWHLNKRHWISTELDGSVPDDELCEFVLHSYALVVKGLTRAQRAHLAEQAPPP
jgi:predicted DNA-binding protein (MmcQ/YjbR family)